MRSATVLGLAATAIAAPSLMERDSSCLSTAQGTFEIAVVHLAGKRSIEARDATPLMITIKDGALTDAKGRVGNIVANQQFQFDPAPGQPHAITTGFSICTEGGVQFLARQGGNTAWERCLSGGFYNLYSTNGAAQCENIKLQVVPVSGSVGQASDGQVTQIPDGQIQATGAVTQIGDGQVQAPTGVVPVVTQIGDGQLQAPTGVVTQIGDGQVQAPTGVVTQIGDGQVQAPTGVVTQIGDGQVQAPTGVVTQIGDGQVQAPTGVVTQIGDGQVQAPTGTPVATPPPTAAGSHIIPGSFALALAAVGVVAAL